MSPYQRSLYVEGYLLYLLETTSPQCVDHATETCSFYTIFPMISSEFICLQTSRNDL